MRAVSSRDWSWVWLGSSHSTQIATRKVPHARLNPKCVSAREVRSWTLSYTIREGRLSWSGNVHERTFAGKRSRGNVCKTRGGGQNSRVGTFARRNGGHNSREGTFARGDLQGHRNITLSYAMWNLLWTINETRDIPSIHSLAQMS